MNKRREGVGYQPLRLNPLMSEGLLPVQREGGDLERRVAQGMFHAAGYFGEKADAQAAKAAYDAANVKLQQGITNASIEFDDGIDDAIASGVTALSRDDARGGRTHSGSVADVLRSAAKKYGQDGESLVAIGYIESKLNPNAKNPRSSAGGVLQFIDGTAKDYGLRNRYNVHEAADAGARLMRDNRQYLSNNLGREPTAGELYLAHQQGAGGALKLLANPNRRASDLVGYDAVKLNGGNASMTAGDFARLWTRKVKTGKSADTKNAAIALKQDDALNSDNVVMPSTLMAKPELRGDDTIYGRTYDKQLVAGYLTQVDAEVSKTTAAVYRKFKDDPRGMAQGFEALRRGFLKDHVLPEIAADFEAAFTRKTGAFIEDAYTSQDQRAKENAVADFTKSTNDLESAQQQTIAGFDVANGNIAGVIAAQQQEINTHYDEAVTRGLMSAPQAANAKIVSSRTAALGFYQKQAESMDVSGVKTMREAMQADMADGGIDGLDGEGFTSLQDGLRAIERKKTIEAEQSKSDLTRRGDAIAQKLAMGFDVDQSELSRLMLDAKTAPDGEAVIAGATEKIRLGRAVRDLPLNEAGQMLADKRKAMGQTPSDGDIEALGFGAAMLEEKRKALATDPQTYAEQAGLIGASGHLSEDDAESVMAARVKSGTAISQEYGIVPRYLKAGEAKLIGDMIRKNPDQGADIAARIVAGSGNQVGAVLAEFGDDAPMVAGAGAILANGGSPRAAQDAILGMNPNIKIKRDASVVRGELDAVMGNALVYQPVDMKRIGMTANAIARQRIDQDGIDPKGDEAADIHERAIHEAAGGTFKNGKQFGGFAEMAINDGWFDGKSTTRTHVMISPTIRADLFKDLIAAVRDEDLSVKPRGGAAQLAGLVPVAVAGGYAFSDGDGDNPSFLPDESGAVFTLNLASMKAILGTRVAGAYK